MLGDTELMAGLIWRGQDRFTYTSGSLVGVTGRLGSSKTVRLDLLWFCSMVVSE